MKKFSLKQIVLAATVFAVTNLLHLNAQQPAFEISEMWNNKFMRISHEWALSFGANGNLGVWGLGMFGNGFNICRIDNVGVTNPANHVIYIDNMSKVGLSVGINPAERLDVWGYVRSHGDMVISDRRYKRDIKPISNLDNLFKINSVQFKPSSEALKIQLELFKQEAPQLGLKESEIEATVKDYENKITERNADTTTHFGFVAQELRDVYPNLVREDKQGFLSVNYTELIPVLVDAIKELKTEVNELKGVRFDKNSSTVVVSEAKLYQNNPNPFSENTEIKFYVPENSNSAMICIYDLVGSQIMKFENLSKGYSSLTVRGSELKAGMYIYALLVDGKEIDTKRMILTDK